MTLWLWIPLGLLAAMVLLVLVSFVTSRNYPWTQADTAASEAASIKGPYWYRLLRAFDVFCNVASGGEEDETISARCGRWSMRPHGHLVQKFMIRWLDVLQGDHGFQAMSGDLARAQRIVKIETDALSQITSRNAP